MFHSFNLCKGLKISKSVLKCIHTFPKVQADPKVLKLPNLVKISRDKKLKCNFNPLYFQVLDDCNSWARKYTTRKSVLDAGLPFCGAFLCPHADYEGLRAGIDSVTLITIFDDFVDESEENIEKHGSQIIEGIYGREGEKGSLGEASYEFFSRLKSISSPEHFENFQRTYHNTVVVTIDEALKRKKNLSLDLETYLKVRPTTVYGDIVWDIVPCIMDFKLPKGVLEHKKLLEPIARKAAENVMFANDTYSFYPEYIKNAHAENLVTILMNERNLSIQEAFDEVGKLYEKHVDEYLKHKHKLMKDFNNDPELLRYIEVAESVANGNMYFCLSSSRYYTKSEMKQIGKSHEIYMKDQSLIESEQKV